MSICSSSSMNSFTSSISNLNENILTVEELDPEDETDVASCLVVRPYEIEDAESECYSISSDPSPSDSRSEIDVKVSSDFNNSILIDSGLGGKTEKSCQRSLRCAKKRTLSLSFGSDVEPEGLDSTSFDETRRPTRRIRPFVSR
ncbi:hypothetical protein EPUL_005258 [Erysiphe pulchra]|uniref:Uncharacterized protein n=1 Tax=Erysiphe pulchra TaxID=225359 RepID=A0A2S4PRN1_9PEZI|nr:hypothetical protein EPUL_005258 [Erysiphe pulchra]